MKFFSKILMVVFFLISFVYARPRMSADDMLEKMKSNLSLTQEQYDQIKPIMEEYISKRSEVMENLRSEVKDRSEIRNEMEALNKDRDEQLSIILDADQMNKWNELQKEMRKERQGRHRE